MCPVTMACANHGVGGGMGASTKGMDGTIARGRRAEHTRQMVGDAIKAHAEEVTAHAKGETFRKGGFDGGF